MSLRISSIAVLVLAGGCGKVVVEKDGSPVSCALQGATTFTEACWSLPVGKDDRWAMTIHHPDGGFRRFSVDAEGTITAADGAESVVQTRAEDGRTQIAIGGDQYRLSARR